MSSIEDTVLSKRDRSQSPCLAESHLRKTLREAEPQTQKVDQWLPGAKEEEKESLIIAKEFPWRG